MRVVLANHGFAHAGGTEVYLLTVAEHFQRLCPRHLRLRARTRTVQRARARPRRQARAADQPPLVVRPICSLSPERAGGAPRASRPHGDKRTRSGRRTCSRPSGCQAVGGAGPRAAGERRHHARDARVAPRDWLLAPEAALRISRRVIPARRCLLIELPSSSSLFSQCS